MRYDANLLQGGHGSFARADANLLQIWVENGGNQKANFVRNNAERSGQTSQGPFD